MSKKIHILSENVMKRIAAGEVVERPAAVVKELIENALDAEATTISLFIKGAGIDLIQVIDNGSGMSEEDALICCERHSTSKITSLHDIDTIRTLGFRGEALASISSVSRMSIITKTDEEEEGTELLIDNGHIEEVLKVAANRGTTVTVRSLFANVPARRKFLKSNSTELRHVITAFRRIALAFPDVDFSLYVEGEKSLDLRKTTQENRIRDLLGEKKFSRLYSISRDISGIRIEGFISRPGEHISSRKDQFIFLNNRFIVNRSLVHAVLSSYGPRINRDEYPIYLLFLYLDPQQFDVNVHPTKIEVRFSDEKFIHDGVKRMLQDSMKKPDATPKLHLIQGGKGSSMKSGSILNNLDNGQLSFDAQRSSLIERDAQERAFSDEKPVLYQLHNRYILSQIKSGLTIIDQHVAHERILYERALMAKREQLGLSQQLLFPQTVQLYPEDFLVLTEIFPHLEKIGFGIKEFGKYTIVIEAVPVEIKTGSEKKILLDIIEQFREYRQESNDTWDAIAKAYACKTAIKSGEQLSQQEMAALIDQLFATQDPYFCPHGRPIVINLTLKEIDERFGR